MRTIDRRDNPEHRVDLRTMTLTLTVSLFMAMFAFFIILNAYASDSKNKLSQARDSISGAFGLIGEGRAQQYTGNTGKGTSGDMEVATSAALRSVLPDVGLQSQHSGSGHTMSVIIPAADFDDRWDELKGRLTDLLMNLNPGGRYHMQILSLKDADAATDLASFAAALENNGVKTTLLSIGLEARGKDAVELRFVTAGN